VEPAGVSVIEGGSKAESSCSRWSKWSEPSRRIFQAARIGTRSPLPEAPSTGRALHPVCIYLTGPCLRMRSRANVGREAGQTQANLRCRHTTVSIRGRTVAIRDGRHRGCFARPRTRPPLGRQQRSIQAATRSRRWARVRQQEPISGQWWPSNVRTSASARGAETPGPGCGSARRITG
jgi:hypothetical protein